MQEEYTVGRGIIISLMENDKLPQSQVLTEV